MFMRALVLAAVVLGGVAVESASAASANERATIRSMPITQRPDRPGHVYGNTVRFFHRLTGGR